MSEGVNTSLISDFELQAKLSWFAYVRRILGFVIMCIVIIIITSLIFNSSAVVNLALGVFTVVYWLLVILSIKAVNIYSDKDGIWVSSGIFPWTKGVYGIKWRDLDEASYYTGFCSWLFRSYTIKLTHRYTKSNEIVIADVWYGNELVQKINEEHIELIKRLDIQQQR